MAVIQGIIIEKGNEAQFTDRYFVIYSRDEGKIRVHPNAWEDVERLVVYEMIHGEQKLAETIDDIVNMQRRLNPVATTCSALGELIHRKYVCRINRARYG